MYIQTLQKSNIAQENGNELSIDTYRCQLIPVAKNTRWHPPAMTVMKASASSQEPKMLLSRSLDSNISTSQFQLDDIDVPLLWFHDCLVYKFQVILRKKLEMPRNGTRPFKAHGFCTSGRPGWRAGGLLYVKNLIHSVYIDIYLCTIYVYIIYVTYVMLYRMNIIYIYIYKNVIYI